MFFKVGVLGNFAEFMGKHPCWSLQVNSNFIRKDTPEKIISCKFCIFGTVKGKICHLNQNCIIFRKHININTCLWSISMISEAVVQMCSVKKVFLEISQNSLENTCVRVFFNKFAGLQPATLLINTIQHRCFLVTFAKFFRTVASVV